MRYPRTSMRGTWHEFSLAALVLCLGCESVATNTVSEPAETTGETSSAPALSASSGDTAGAEGTAAGSGGTGPDGTSSTGASPDGTSTGSASSDGASSDGTSSDLGGTSATTTATTTAGASTGGQVSARGDRTHACLEYVLGFCEFIARCSGDLEGIIPCYESSSFSCPDVLFAPGSARTVDGTFACADAWRALACELPRPECATAGTLANDEACVSGIQCASRLCSGNAESCGTCLPTAKLGEACDNVAGPQCEGGLLCHTTQLVCVGPTDSALGGLEIGEECDPTTSGCYPNYCGSDDAVVYTCKPYPKLGEDCSSTWACVPGDSYCDATLVCLALPTASQFCGVDASGGAARWCAEGLVCDTTFDPPLCLTPPAAPGLGEPCEGACQTGLTCRCTDDACDSPICLWARFAGESCSAPDEACLMGECVDGTCVVSETASTFGELCGE